MPFFCLQPALSEAVENSGRRKLEAIPTEHLGEMPLEGTAHTEVLPVTDTGRKYVSHFQYQVRCRLC